MSPWPLPLAPPPPAAGMDPIPAMVLVAVLLSASFCFSSSETALFSLQAVDREALRSQGAAGERVETLLSRRTRTLASILMGNELVNISTSAVCTGLVLTLAPDKPWLNVVVATPLLLLLGEVTPKRLALAFPRRFARALSRPLLWWDLLITPARALVVGVARGLQRLLGVTEELRHTRLEEGEVLKLLEEGHEAGAVRDVERQLIDRLFDFSDTTVARLMTPRPDIISFSITTPYERMVAELREHKVSRVPIYQGRMDNVLGVLLSKDLLRFKSLGTPPTPRELRALLQDPFYVPSTKRADELLREFQRRRSHLALVVDEHGSLIGLVTLDDLLVELVGEMLDELDDATEEVRADGQDMWVIDASVDVEDLNDRLDLSIPEGEYHTLAGFITATLGRIPEVGESLTHAGRVFEVTGAEGRRVTEVRIRPVVAEAPAQPPEESAP